MVEIEYTDGDIEVGILHKETPAIKYQNPDGDNAPIIRYCLVTPIRNIVFFNSDIKSIREERYGN